MAALLGRVGALVADDAGVLAASMILGGYTLLGGPGGLSAPGPAAGASAESTASGSPAAGAGPPAGCCAVRSRFLAIVLVVEISARAAATAWFQQSTGGDIRQHIGSVSVWGCYLGLTFMGEKPVHLWGSAFFRTPGNSFCTPEVTGRFLTHFPNLLLQIWAENGVVSPCRWSSTSCADDPPSAAQNTAHSPQPGADRRWVGQLALTAARRCFPLLTRLPMVELG